MRKRYYRKDKVLQEDADPLKNMTITAIALAEDLRTSISFGESDVPMKWKRFMTFFSMLYGVTKYFIGDKEKGDIDEFMKRWFLYGYAVKRYRILKVLGEEGRMSEEGKGALEELGMIFREVNPPKSLAVFERFVNILKERGIYTIAESTIVDEGFGDDEK